MGKRRQYADSELDRLQRLKHENQKLKRENSRLKKQLDRIDDSHFANLKEVIESQERSDQADHDAKKNEKLAKHWACWDCKEGTLRLCIVERRDGVFYFRKCDNCPKKGRLKPFNDKVEGLKPEDK